MIGNPAFSFILVYSPKVYFISEVFSSELAKCRSLKKIMYEKY